ncbi:MAG TPA: N-acetylglucosamine-6-phosphate deacetylase [Pyrinomonadaceae bacterium]|nr:N-acetylglucosamine-6-phosphate deacetylase [Pyrinomonadaceae bacterium]
MLLKNAKIILTQTETPQSSVIIKQEYIKEILSTVEKTETEQTIDIGGASVFAGFIDIHNHGAVGVDVNTASAEDLREVSKFLATRGVTGWLPTFVPDATENYRKVIEAIDEAMEKQSETEAAARILGVHYEGVFANEQMCGALRPRYFKTFKNGDEIDEIPMLKTPNAIHLTTLAPEIENGIELIKELKKRNWIVSIGHTKADVEILDKAFEAGASHITHLFNAMTGVHHRDIGVAGWALAKDEIFCEIIADGVHVAPPMLFFAYKNKTAEKLALVSDSVAPTGLGDGDFELWNEKISVVNGKTQNERGSIAGSVITMLDAVKMMLSLGISIEEVSRMASFVPAKVLGIEQDYGSIETGKRADLVAIDEKGDVKLTIVGGRVAFMDM